MTGVGTLRRLRGMLGTLTARQVILFVAADAVLLVVGVALGLVVARALGAPQFGQLSVVLAFAALVFTFLDLRAAETVTRFLTDYRARGKPAGALAVVKLALYADFGLALVGLLAVLGMRPLLGGLLGDVPLTTTLLAVMPVALGAPTATTRGVLLAVAGMSRTLFTQVVAVAVRLTGTVVLVLGPHDLHRVVLVLFAVAAVEYVVATAVAFRRVRADFGAWPWSADLSIVRPRAPELLRFTMYVDASSLVGAVVKQADVLILGAFAGSLAAGQYRLGKQVSVGAATLGGSLQTWLYPQLADAFGARDEERFRQLLRRATLLLGLPGALLTLAALPFLPWFISATAGNQFSGAVVPAQLLTAGAAASTLMLVFRPAYLAAGRLRTFLTIVTLTSVMCLVGFLAVSDTWGANGVAVVRLVAVSLVGNAIGALLLLRWCSRRNLLASAGGQGIRETET